MSLSRPHKRRGLLALALLLGLCPRTEASAPPKKKEAAPAEAKAAENPATSFVKTRGYVHQWLEMPRIKGQNLAGQDVTLAPKPGHLEVVIFLATTCIPCQHIMEPLQALEREFRERNARFTYVFSHDTLTDTREFARVFKLPEAILAGHDLLKDYHDPLVPSIYIGDRHGWLLTRFEKANGNTPKELAVLLKHLTVY